MRNRNSPGRDQGSIKAVQERLGERYFFVEEADQWLFTENETNPRRAHGREEIRLL